MAEKQNQQRSAARYTRLWMLLAILTVGGFLMWVSVNSEPREVAVAEGAEPEGPRDDRFEVIDPEEFAVDPQAYLGREVHLSELDVAAPMGSRAYWVTLPDGNLYLVKLGETIGEQVTAREGERLTVAGPIVAMSDSVVAAWTEEGAIATDGQRTEAEFAISFIEAVEASVTAGSEEDDAAEELGPDTAETEG
jgi:hypothetical protein